MHSIQRVYNQLSELQTSENANGAANASYTYDPNGNPNAVTDGRGIVTDNSYQSGTDHD
ncbi:MAG TPA: hypothetical protein VK660_02470 [Xanthomonadaceae bacterium]|nr:hypothetical protein [Xanthomonadaceae bacterium]